MTAFKIGSAFSTLLKKTFFSIINKRVSVAAFAETLCSLLKRLLISPNNSPSFNFPIT